MGLFGRGRGNGKSPGGMTIERTWGEPSARDQDDDKPELARQQAEQAYLENIEACIRRHVKKTYPDNQFGRDAWFDDALARRAPSTPESLLVVLSQHDVSIVSTMDAIWDDAYQQSPGIFSSDTEDASVPCRKHVGMIERRVELEHTLELLCGYWSAAEHEQNEARTQKARAIVDAIEQGRFHHPSPDELREIAETVAVTATDQVRLYSFEDWAAVDAIRVTRYLAPNIECSALSYNLHTVAAIGKVVANGTPTTEEISRIYGSAQYAQGVAATVLTHIEDMLIAAYTDPKTTDGQRRGLETIGECTLRERSQPAVLQEAYRAARAAEVPATQSDHSGTETTRAAVAVHKTTAQNDPTTAVGDSTKHAGNDEKSGSYTLRIVTGGKTAGSKPRANAGWVSVDEARGIADKWSIKPDITRSMVLGAATVALVATAAVSPAAAANHPPQPVNRGIQHKPDGTPYIKLANPSSHTPDNSAKKGESTVTTKTIHLQPSPDTTPPSDHEGRVGMERSGYPSNATLEVVVTTNPNPKPGEPAVAIHHEALQPVKQVPLEDLRRDPSHETAYVPTAITPAPQPSPLLTVTPESVTTIPDSVIRTVVPSGKVEVVDTPGPAKVDPLIAQQRAVEEQKLKDYNEYIKNTQQTPEMMLEVLASKAETQGFPKTELPADLQTKVGNLRAMYLEDMSGNAMKRHYMSLLIVGLEHPLMFAEGNVKAEVLSLEPIITMHDLSAAQAKTLEEIVNSSISSVEKQLFGDDVIAGISSDTRASLSRLAVLAELTQKAQPEIVDQIAASDKAKADAKAKAEAKKAAEQEKANGNNGTVEQSPITPEIYLKALIDDDVPEQYAKLYIEFGNKYSVSPVLLAMQGRQESINFKPEVVDGRQHSPAGAMGISQFMEATWEAWKKKLGFPDEATPFQPRYAIEAQAALMKSNLSKATGMINKDPSITKLGISASGLALAGYNAGWGNIENHGVKKVATQWEETSKYIKIIKGNMAKIDQHIERLTPAKLEVKSSQESKIIEQLSPKMSDKTKQFIVEAITKGLVKNSVSVSKKAEAQIRTTRIETIKDRGGKNGYLDDSFLDRIGEKWGKWQLDSEAAKSFRDMAAAYEAEFGKVLRPIGLYSDYRSFYGQQIMKDDATRKGRPQYAATPGTSNHGFGLACDIFDMEPGSKELKWMEDNAWRWGWFKPFNHSSKGAVPEPWHWEFWPEEY